MKPLNILEIQEKTGEYWQKALEKEIEHINNAIAEAAEKGEYSCWVYFPSHSRYLNIIDIFAGAGYQIECSIINNTSRKLQVFEPINNLFEERKMIYSQDEALKVEISWEKNI